MSRQSRFPALGMAAVVTGQDLDVAVPGVPATRPRQITTRVEPHGGGTQIARRLLDRAQQGGAATAASTSASVAARPW